MRLSTTNQCGTRFHSRFYSISFQLRAAVPLSLARLSLARLSQYLSSLRVSHSVLANPWLQLSSVRNHLYSMLQPSIARDQGWHRAHQLIVLPLDGISSKRLNACCSARHESGGCGRDKFIIGIGECTESFMHANNGVTVSLMPRSTTITRRRTATSMT